MNLAGKLLASVLVIASWSIFPFCFWVFGIWAPRNVSWWPQKDASQAGVFLLAGFFCALFCVPAFKDIWRKP